MATRLHVGGLGERVTEDDLRNTFSHLGSIQTVDIIRTKGRSFAYINFLPTSDNSLAKLFSTYNGCLWKGGKLKLEKAKEHYMDRLKQEWAEDAELVNSGSTNQNDVDENMAAPTEPKSTLDVEKMQLRMFFPKLRKVKSLPFRGTGKHKYSFQRVVVPPLPVHFCDCPEHCEDIQNDKINDKEISMMNSVMNKLLNKETSQKSGCIHPPRGAQVDDSKIQDDGVTDEEIHVMNSVMKKLLDREIAKTEQKDLHDSPQITTPTLELPEDKNEIDEETDDDDIKINTVAGQDFGSESWELQTSLLNKMARSDEPTKSKLGTQNRKVKPSDKKRKSVSNDSNDKDPASPIRKKVHFQTRSMKSEDHSTEYATKKLITNGLWSQKSSRKELVGDGSYSSFHLSHVIPGGETNNNEQPLCGGETSTDSKKSIRVSNVVNEKHDASNTTLSDSKELERVSNSVPENLDGQSSLSKDKEELEAAQPAGPSAGLDKTTRGRSWLQKLPWTQLVGGGKSSSFSISQILPEDLLVKQQLNKPNDSSTSNSFYNSVDVGNEHRSKPAFGGSRSARPGLAGEDKKKDAQASVARSIHLSKAPKGNDCTDSTISKKSDLQQKELSNSLPGVGISDSCPFMRSADSLKDWQTAKTTLTGALKKRNNNNKKQGFAL